MRASLSPDCSTYKIQLSANTPGKAIGDVPSWWAPACHVRGLDEAPGSWLSLGPTMDIGNIWERNQKMKDLYLPLPLSLSLLYLSYKQTFLKKEFWFHKRALTESIKILYWIMTLLLLLLLLLLLMSLGHPQHFLSFHFALRLLRW